MENLGVWIYIGIVVTIFMSPTIIAFTSRHPHPFGILIANVVIKPTITQWLFVLFAAMHGRSPRRW